MSFDAKCAATEMSAQTYPNIHDILMKIDVVLSETNDQACRIRNFLMSQPMAKAEKEPGGATDMLSHVTDINDKAMALQDELADISKILGM